MSEVIKTIEGVDKLFSEIEINNVTYKTAKESTAKESTAKESTAKESTAKESTTSLTETVSSDSSNVSGVNLNSIYHAIEDTNARANVRTALLQIINEIIAREQADTQLQENINAEAQTRETSDIQLQDNINTEESIRSSADTQLQSSLDIEIQTRSSADTQLQENINAEAQTRATKDTQLQNSVDTINSKIPSQATVDNQLADKDFVNSSIATNTANFIGTFTDIEELKRQPATNNDYAFWLTTDSAGNILFKRYKYIASTNSWVFEYDLNNSSFTSEQWLAIQSGITAVLVAKLKGIEEGAQVNTITGVKGGNESSYRTGNVNITKDNVGLGNVGNFKAVSTVASQGLTESEKANARSNIGAGISSFSGSYTDLTNKPTSLKNPNALTINGKTYDGSSVVNAGVQTVANGGTGVTTQADINKAIVGKLTEGNDVVTDGTMFISSWASDNGFADTNATNVPYKRRFSRVWEYIKGKISSVLGLTATNYSGKASTAGTADKTVNDITIKIPHAQEGGQYVIPFGNIPEPTSTEIDSPYNWDITGFFSIIRPTGHNGSHIKFEAGHGYSHDWTTYAYLDKLDFRYVSTSIKAFQYEGKWWLGLCIITTNQGYYGKMTITYSRGSLATPTCILYNSKSDGVANEEIFNSIQDIPSSWWKTRTIHNPTTFIQNITAPNITSLEESVAGKSDIGHTHTKSQITDFPTSLPANGGTAETATKATSVVDYGNTSKTIKIGYSGPSVTIDNLSCIAGYTNNGTQIKDVAKDTLKSWLGLGSAPYINTLDIAISSEVSVTMNTFTSSAINAPVATDGLVITHHLSSTKATQLALCGAQIFTRKLSGTTWSAWSAVWNTEES